MPVGVHVVFVDVGDRRDHGREVEEGCVRFVRFRDEEFAGPEAGIRPRGIELPADHEGGIEPASSEERRGQRRRGGLSVRARNRDAAPQAHQFSEHHRAWHDGNAELAGGDHFRVVGLHGRGNNHGIRTTDVLFVVSEKNAGPELLQALGDGRAGNVRAADDVAEIEEHLGDAAHARAADADEVEVINEKLHVLSFDDCLSAAFSTLRLRARRASLRLGRRHFWRHRAPQCCGRLQPPGESFRGSCRQ